MLTIATTMVTIAADIPKCDLPIAQISDNVWLLGWDNNSIKVGREEGVGIFKTKADVRIGKFLRYGPAAINKLSTFFLPKKIISIIPLIGATGNVSFNSGVWIILEP